MDDASPELSDNRDSWVGRVHVFQSVFTPAARVLEAFFLSSHQAHDARRISPVRACACVRVCTYV